MVKGELAKVSLKLIESNRLRDEIRGDLIRTKHEIDQEKRLSQVKFDEVQNAVDAHGIPQPKWTNLVHYGVVHENMSKEKNYVVPINCIVDGTGDVDVPACIASFAHDYAGWIAYRADQASLKLSVTGKNPEDLIYAEDDTELRRKGLVQR